MKKINKTKARKLYNQGHTIYLMPCNFRLGNMWVSPCPISCLDNMASFDSQVNNFEYYNCTMRETGLYSHYYVKED